jgi:hypothetical protein
MLVRLPALRSRVNSDSLASEVSEKAHRRHLAPNDIGTGQARQDWSDPTRRDGDQMLSDIHR